MTGWLGDAPSDIGLHLVADADFARDIKLSLPTGRLHLTLLGPAMVYPISGQCNKQGCVLHSTP